MNERITEALLEQFQQELEYEEKVENAGKYCISKVYEGYTKILQFSF